MNNAIQAVEQKAQLRIEFSLYNAQTDAPPQLLIRVLDTGPGIPQHLLSSVGDLFVTTKAQGTGLGLAVVNAVARAHRGKFYLQSKVGQGTCASLVMPLAELH